MSPLGKRIIVLTMAWVFLVMVLSQLYDNISGRGMPAQQPALADVPTPVPTVAPDADITQLASLQSCVAADPNNLQCSVDLANLYYAAHQWPQAQVDYERAVKLSPHDVGLLLKLAGTYIYQQQFDLAVATLQQAASLQPDSPEIHLLLGLALSKVDPPRMTEAVAQWHQVVTLAPGSDWASQANQYIQDAAK